jgi:thiamine-monophosphate kinase
VGSPKLGHTPRLVEDETLERIRRTLGNGIEAPDLRDDAALVDVPGGGPLVVSVDSVVAGVHVDLELCSPADIGWKALMGALSDLGAMGARPVGALVALCVPPTEAGSEAGSEAGGELTLGVMAGVAEASRAAGCPVVGGDVSAGATLVVAVTVLGTLGSGCAVARRGASAGDAILVTGPCGGSAAGLRVLRAGSERGGVGATLTREEKALAAAYRRPLARLNEGEAARLAGAHAMIDVSDGLALDLHRLADASAVGFALDAVPVAEGATEAEALGGGEDYELIVVMAPGAVDGYEARCREAGLRPPRRIGSVTARIGDRTWRGRPLAQLGWQHRLG